jgi:signal transduction histidine kinase
MFNTLYIKLSATQVLLFLLIGVALVLLTRYSSDRYYQEVTQRLNSPIAKHVAEEGPLIEHGKANADALQALAHQAMIINPSVEVYLLDPVGRILTHDLGDNALRRHHIDLQPIRRFLSGAIHLPLLGDDPRTSSDKKIFTAAEVKNGDHLAGYVYIVLSGKKYEQFATSAEASEVLRLTTLAVIGCLIFGLGSALLIFGRLSRQLRDLTASVNDFHHGAMGAPPPQSSRNQDEITQLALAFDAMQTRIEDQVDQIRKTDQMRRELITNISHDLRTPLTAMQGYIETLLLKDREITPQQQHEYLEIAHDHGVRLSRMIADLFELAKLDANAVKPQLDEFSLTELVADIVQEFRLTAERKSVALVMETNGKNSAVYADIRLIERVFQNLIENGLRHTPAHGRITVKLDGHDQGVRVTISDTGAGIEEEALPYIFDRYFQASPKVVSATESTGLGLAIVKRLLDLHHTAIVVRSRLAQGTSFSFELPRYVSPNGGGYSAHPGEAWHTL